jgi:hypothetical protein
LVGEYKNTEWVVVDGTIDNCGCIMPNENQCAEDCIDACPMSLEFIIDHEIDMDELSAQE